MESPSTNQKSPSTGARLVGAGLVLLVIVCVGIGVAIQTRWLNKSAEDWLEEGESALERRDYATALDSLQHAVQRDPDHVLAWELLAQVASRGGFRDQSISALEQLARLDPAKASAVGVQLGSYWMSRNLIQPAIKSLRLAAMADPTAPQPDRLLAQIYGVTGHRAEVARCLVRLIQKEAFTFDDLVVLSSVNPSIDDPDRLQMMLQAEPSDKSPLLPQAMYALDLNRVPDAERLLLEMTASDPRDLEAQSILGELYADFFPARFVDWNSRLPAIAEEDGRIWLARGKWLNRRGLPEPAIRCLAEALLRGPENLSVNMLMGQLLKSRGLAETGTLFTNRARALQRIMDLSSRMNEPRAAELIEPMIDELESTGRLWEAWGWCVVAEKSGRVPHLERILSRKQELAARLTPETPRTIAASLPGNRDEWTQHSLPDWSHLQWITPDSSPNENPGPTEIRFEDQAARAGLDFQYVSTQSQEQGHKIYETMGAGVAAVDYDLDGWPDLYFAQGKPLPLDSRDGPSDRLYRNLRGQQLQAVSDLAGIRETSYSQGVTTGDFNNDGFPDLYVANLGRNRLLRNQGDGTFCDVTDEAGLGGSTWTVSCAIADLNGDGLPELFDVNYCEGKDFLTATCYDEYRRSIVCRPTMFDAAADTVVFNRGDGTFQELQAEAGLDLPLGMGLGLVIGNFNDDALPDLFIANDMTANFLLMNETAGVGQTPRFRDEAFLRGVALDGNGLAQACMGIATADINHDGQLDLFVTNFARESNTLYLSQPGGMYEDQTQNAGLREPSFSPLGFGTQFLDADRDGRLDLVVANGHIDEFLNEPYRMKAQFFRGEANGRFMQVTAEAAGGWLNEPRLARGLALLDWNRDGKLDFVMTDLERPVLLATNHTENRNRVFRLKFVGTESSRDAIGTIVRIELPGGDSRVAQLTAGDGYESCNERLVEFGIGDADVVSQVEIRWPTGKSVKFNNVAVSSVWLAVEGAVALISTNFADL